MVLERSGLPYRVFYAANALARLVWPESIIFHAPSAQKVDLCTFIRTITWTGPLSLIVVVVGWGFICWLSLQMPIETGGWSLLPIGLLLLVAVAIYGISKGLQRFSKWMDDRPYRPRPPRKPSAIGAGIVSLIDLIALAISAAKQKICPILEVK